jgi:thioredoxin-related protein
MIMKKSLWICCVILINITLVYNTNAQGIKFNYGKWEEVKAEAKAQNKLIFIDFGTVWCAPCRYMQQNIFPQKEVGDFYNKNFICVTVDAEKGEGIMLARKYKVGGFPTLIFADAEEKVIYRVDSFLNVAELIKQGEIALTPRDDYGELNAKYLKDELNKDELYRYLLIVKTKGNARQLNEVLEKYVVLFPNVSINTFNAVAENVRSPDSKAFNFVEQHRDEFGKVAGKDMVDSFIRKTYLNDANYKNYKSEEDYVAAINNLKLKINLTEHEELTIANNHYYQTNNKEKFMAVASILAAKYDNNNDEALSLLIGGSEHFNLLPNDLLIVKSWAERALALNNNTVNALSLAMVYKSLKNKEQALKYINQALENSLRDKDNEEGHLAVFKKQIEDAAY